MSFFQISYWWNKRLKRLLYKPVWKDFYKPDPISVQEQVQISDIQNHIEYYVYSNMKMSLFLQQICRNVASTVHQWILCSEWVVSTNTAFHFSRHSLMDWSCVGYLRIIVMFLSAVWTLILTAPIHCSASIADARNAVLLQICSNEETNSTSWIFIFVCATGPHTCDVWPSIYI